MAAGVFCVLVLTPDLRGTDATMMQELASPGVRFPPVSPAHGDRSMGERRRLATASGDSSYWAREFRRRWKLERRANHARARIIRRLRRDLAAVDLTVREAICLVFGPYCGQALAVVDCESNFYTGASNGQYQGLFQMGSSERQLYGHGPSALEQARAAWRYFVASGRDWSPWACRP